MNFFKSVSSIAETFAVSTEKVLKSGAVAISNTAEIAEEAASTALAARKQTKKLRITLAVNTFVAEAGKELEQNKKDIEKSEAVLGKPIMKYMQDLQKEYGIKD